MTPAQTAVLTEAQRSINNAVALLSTDPAQAGLELVLAFGLIQRVKRVTAGSPRKDASAN